MCNTGKVGRHLGNLRLEALIEHLYHFIVLPPGFGDVMIGKDFSVIGGKESGAKNVKVHLPTTPNKSH